MQVLIKCILLSLIFSGIAYAEVIRQADFEGGDLTDVDNATCPLKTFVEASAAKNGAYGLRIGYNNTGSGDVNCGVEWTGLATHSLDYFWLSFWLKLDASIDAGVHENRKIIYMWGASSSWDLLLKADGTTYPVDLLVASNCAAFQDFCVEHIAQDIYGDTWYYVEMEVQLNTAGSSNGYVKIYVDSSAEPIASFANKSIRNDTNSLNIIRFGAQQEGDYPTPSWHEDRWFDDITISTTRLGGAAATVVSIGKPLLP